MTGDDTLATLVDSATELAAWYRQGGNPQTDRYTWLMDALATAVTIYHQHQPTP